MATFESRWDRYRKLGCTDKVTNGHIPNLGGADPTISVVPKMWICVTESWQPKLGGTGMESVSPKWLGFGWICLRWESVAPKWKCWLHQFWVFGYDRLWWESLWVFLATITCARLSILFTSKTLPPFNSIGFPMDSKWFLTNIKCRVLLLEAWPTYFLATWGISTISFCHPYHWTFPEIYLVETLVQWLICCY